MNKYDFIISLSDKLYGLPQEEVEEHLNFYLEIIEDRIEDGLSEEDAVASVGPVKEIAAQILADIPLAKIAKEKIHSKRRLRAGETVLLVLGSPIWLSLGIAAAAVMLSLYVSLWAVIISLWAAFASVVATAVGSILAGLIQIVLMHHAPAGITLLAAAILCAGLSIFLFFGCKACSKGILTLTKKVPVWIKRCFVKKEDL